MGLSRHFDGAIVAPIRELPRPNVHLRTTFNVRNSDFGFLPLNRDVVRAYGRSPVLMDAGEK